MGVLEILVLVLKRGCKFKVELNLLKKDAEQFFWSEEFDLLCLNNFVLPSKVKLEIIEAKHWIFFWNCLMGTPSFENFEIFKKFYGEV